MDSKTIEFKSLYDYLGRKAGPELGKIVYQTAKIDKIPVQQKDVSNPLYEGKVMMYPTEWLNKFFKKS